jgi:hypothetical protein
MKSTVLRVIVLLSALVATEALAQRPAVDQNGREFRPPRDAGVSSRTGRSDAQRQSTRSSHDARAEGRAGSAAAFNGSWSVAIITRSGACDSQYRFGVQIINGNVVYEGRPTGRVSSNGGVSVTISAGSPAGQRPRPPVARSGQRGLAWAWLRRHLRRYLGGRAALVDRRNFDSFSPW